MERAWKLGEDLLESDNVLDPITFEGIITAVRCGCEHKTTAAVHKVANDMLECCLEDFRFLIENNMDEIIEAAEKGVRKPLTNAPGWDSARLEALAREIYQYLRGHEMWIDISIYYDGKRMSTEGESDGKHVFRYNGEPFIEENMDPRDYFEYVANPHILSMSFESSFYDVVNYVGGPILDGFEKLLSRHGLYYELGHAWNLSVVEG